MSHHTTILTPGERSFGSLADLPKRIKNKISLQGDERLGCWMWTGYFLAARPTRFKHYPVHPDYDGHRDSHGYFGNERGVPKVKHPGKGYSVDAHRYVYALLTDLEYDDTPRLARCGDERCVSPWHVHEMGQPPINRRAPRPVAVAVASNQLTPAYLLALLKDQRPFAGAGTAAMEEAVGLPAGSIPLEVAQAYIVWDETAPEPDDD